MDAQSPRRGHASRPDRPDRSRPHPRRRQPMTKTLIAALCAAAMALPATTAYAVQSPEIAAATDTAFDRRAAQLVELLTARIPFADYFDPSFQTAIPQTQFKAITARSEDRSVGKEGVSTGK